MTILIYSLILTAVPNVGAAGVVLPSGIELERIADETYDPPGIPGEILIIEQTVPVVCSGQVLFTAVTELDIHAAIYAASSEGIEVVANATTPIPGTPDTFLRARGASCAGERILFLGGPGASSVTGVYSSSGGVIEELLPADTTFGPLSFVSFVEARAEPDGGEGFDAVGPIFQLGVGTTDGLIRKPFGPAPPQLLAEGFSTLLPGRAVPPDTLSEPLVRASDVVFRATFPPLGDGGIYRWSPAVGFSLVAGNTTFYPDLGSSIAGFEFLTSLDAGVAFSALAAGGFGIYLARDDGSLAPLVVPGDQTTDGGVISSARYPGGAGSLLTFTGRTVADPARDAIFVRRPSGEIVRILGAGDEIEGRLMGRVLSGADDRDVAIWTQSVTGGFPNVVIYRISFGDVIAVEVPVLSLAGIALLALLIATGGWWFLCRVPGGRL